MIEAHLLPGGRGPGSFRHPKQQARFQVLRGRLGLRVGERDLRLGPGERLTVPADAEYAYWNAGSEPALVVAEIRPALEFEALLARLFTTTEEK